MSANRKIDPLIIPIDKYDNIEEKVELSEHIEIFNIIRKREKIPLSKSIPLEKVLEEYKKH